MYLMRIGAPGSEIPVVRVDGESYVDVSDVVTDLTKRFFGTGPEQLTALATLVETRVAAGQNVPAEPILFTKSPNTQIGPNDDVRIPRGSTKLDWEVELGIVIGRRASYLADEDQARAAIAGYVVVNNVSERAFQIDVMEVSIDGLGSQRQTVVAPR